MWWALGVYGLEAFLIVVVSGWDGGRCHVMEASRS